VGGGGGAGGRRGTYWAEIVDYLIVRNPEFFEYDLDNINISSVLKIHIANPSRSHKIQHEPP
jgi:hypothetical protein